MLIVFLTTKMITNNYYIIISESIIIIGIFIYKLTNKIRALSNYYIEFEKDKLIINEKGSNQPDTWNIEVIDYYRKTHKCFEIISTPIMNIHDRMIIKIPNDSIDINKVEKELLKRGKNER